MKVVVAGRVSTGPAVEGCVLVWLELVWLEDEVWGPLAVCPDGPDCVGEEVWAAPDDATASVNTAAITTRFNIRTSASVTHRSHARATRLWPAPRLLDDSFRGQRRGGFGRFHESPATAAADLTSLAAGIARFVRSPLVSGSLLMSGAASLAGDLPLLLGRHRGEAAAFLALCVHHCAILCVNSHDLSAAHPDLIGHPARRKVRCQARRRV